MTQQEIEAISEKAKIIANLDIVAFLNMIKEKAHSWKDKING